MSFTPPPGEVVRFNPPPNWPAPPPGFKPSRTWRPDPSWPPPPAGWRLWVRGPLTGEVPGSGLPAGEAPGSGPQAGEAPGSDPGTGGAPESDPGAGGVPKSDPGAGGLPESGPRAGGLPDGGRGAGAGASTARRRRGRWPVALIACAAVAVICVGLGYLQRPHPGGQDWFAVGKVLEPAAEQQDAGVPIGPGSHLATTCTAYLNAARPAQRPAAADATAVSQWVQGCEAAYHQAHPDRLVQLGTVTATGAFGAAPVVTIPARQAAASLYVKTLIQGKGARMTAADGAVANYVVYDWSGTTHKLLGSSYASGRPSLFVGKLLPGLAKALAGQKAGSRVLAVIPPADGFGKAGSAAEGIGGGDTLVFVVDLDSTFNSAGVPGTQASTAGGALPTVTPPASDAAGGPVITIPAGVAPPRALQAKALIKGTGAVVRRGQDIAVQYTGVLWRTGKVFSSSWSGSAPLTTPIGEGQVIKGWDAGLVGQTVGSRVLLVIPPADAYGTAGEPKVGINGTDTLVFVVDILAAA